MITLYEQLITEYRKNKYNLAVFRIRICSLHDDATATNRLLARLRESRRHQLSGVYHIHTDTKFPSNISFATVIDCKRIEHSCTSFIKPLCKELNAYMITACKVTDILINSVLTNSLPIYKIGCNTYAILCVVKTVEYI